MRPEISLLVELMARSRFDTSETAQQLGTRRDPI
jgi:hypothetical protein